jgi:hypothetical protein
LHNSILRNPAGIFMRCRLLAADPYVLFAEQDYGFVVATAALILIFDF